jgi:hypothetical protein
MTHIASCTTNIYAEFQLFLGKKTQGRMIEVLMMVFFHVTPYTTPLSPSLMIFLHLLLEGVLIRSLKDCSYGDGEIVLNPIPAIIVY